MMIISDKARISNENMQVQFRLTNGKAFLYSSDRVTQINFDPHTSIPVENLFLIDIVG